MPILNYTTKIPAGKTVAEVQQILANNGALAVNVAYVDMQPDALTFVVDGPAGPVNFQLPARWRGVLRALEADGAAARYCTEDHARRVAWRIVKDWVEAQMAIINAHMAEMAEVFLPYAVAQDGRTLYQQFAARQLGAGNGE